MVWPRLLVLPRYASMWTILLYNLTGPELHCAVALLLSRRPFMTFIYMSNPKKQNECSSKKHGLFSFFSHTHVNNLQAKVKLQLGFLYCNKASFTYYAKNALVKVMVLLSNCCSKQVTLTLSQFNLCSTHYITGPQQLCELYI